MGPTTGATSPQLQPEAAMLESWPSFQEKSEVWVFMYNLFILNVSNLFQKILNTIKVKQGVQVGQFGLRRLILTLEGRNLLLPRSILS